MIEINATANGQPLEAIPQGTTHTILHNGKLKCYDNYADYITGYNEVFPPNPQQIAKQAIKEARRKQKAFAGELLEDFEADMLVLGLQNESKQTRLKLKSDTANLIASIANGEFDIALDLINAFPAASKDGKYITDQRLTDLKNSIIQFLNS